MRITAILNLITNLFRSVAAAVLLIALHHASAWDWALASTTVSIFAAICAVVTVTSQFGRPKLKIRSLFRHGFEGLGYSFAGSTTSVYNDVDKTMLSHYGMNHANGIYTMAYRMIDIATIPIGAVQEAALPRMFQRGRTGLGAVTELSRRLLRRTLPIGFFLTAVVFVIAPLIPRLLGVGFSEVTSALRWLCLILVFRGVHQTTGGALTGAGLQNYRTLAQVVAAAVNVCLNLWLIPRYGWRGAAWSSAATDALLAGMNWGLLAVKSRPRIAVTENAV